MPTGQGVTQYIDITDFTTGIVGRVYAPELATDGAAAHVLNDGANFYSTENCVFHRFGGIYPGPGVEDGFILTDSASSFFTTPNTSAHRHPDLTRVVVSAVGIVSPVHGDSSYRDIVYVLYNWVEDPLGLGGYRHFWRLRGHDLWKLSYTKHNVGWEKASLIDPWPADSSFPPSAPAHYGYGFIDNTAQLVNVSGPPAFAFYRPAVSWAASEWAGNVISATTNVAQQLPSDQNVDPVAPWDMDSKRISYTPGAISYLVCHQGRTVVLHSILYGSSHVGRYGPRFGKTNMEATEEMVYTNPLSRTIPSAPPSAPTSSTIFAEESFFGVGAMASMNANELLFVKHLGGGGVIRGPLSSPQVQRIPSLPGTDGFTHRPVVTPKGLVYVSRDRAFLWNGGDSVVDISELLEVSFDAAAALDSFLPQQALRATLAYSHPYVFFPKGFVYNLELGYWTVLRINSSTVPNFSLPRPTHFVKSASGHIYALLDYVNRYSPTDPTLGFRVSIGNVAPWWSWISQTISKSRGRKIVIREMVLKVTTLYTSANSLMTVKIVGNGTLFSKTFTVTGKKYTQEIRFPVNVEGTNIHIYIESRGPGFSYAPAPAVNSISIGYHDGSSSPVT